MKKFLTAAAIALLCYAPVVDAAFYDDTSRYVPVVKSMEFVSYVDMDSVESVRYDPPFYILKGRLVSVGYNYNNMITYNTYKIFYDIDTRTAKYQLIQLRSVDEDGSIKFEVDIEKEKKIQKTELIKYGTPLFYLAEGLFYKYYGEHFFKEFLKYN